MSLDVLVFFLVFSPVFLVFLVFFGPAAALIPGGPAAEIQAVD
jgi:hypothetical protein